MGGLDKRQYKVEGGTVYVCDEFEMTRIDYSNLFDVGQYTASTPRDWRKVEHAAIIAGKGFLMLDEVCDGVSLSTRYCVDKVRCFSIVRTGELVKVRTGAYEFACENEQQAQDLFYFIAEYC